MKIFPKIKFRVFDLDGLFFFPLIPETLEKIPRYFLKSLYSSRQERERERTKKKNPCVCKRVCIE